MRIIGGTFKNHPLKAPKGVATRPTSSMLREAVFNICQHKIEGSSFLDLFAGSGAMGLEALSRGALWAAFVDQSIESLRCIQQNLEQLKMKDHAQILRGDIWRMLEKLDSNHKCFQIIYVDPPYVLGAEEEFWNKFSDVLFSKRILDANGLLFLEQGKDASMPPLDGKHLRLVNSRKMGAATLHQFIKEED